MTLAAALWFFLTTAGTDRNSICWRCCIEALDILEGRKIDPRFAVLFDLPDERTGRTGKLVPGPILAGLHHHHRQGAATPSEGAGDPGG